MQWKYRIWDNLNNCYFKPVYRGNVREIEEVLLMGNGDICLRTYCNFIHESALEGRFEPPEFFTGFCDKRGNEVYQNDLIRYPSYISGDYEVRGRVELVDYDLNGFNDSLLTGYAEHPYWIEVIGNIHLHAHLMEMYCR